MPTKGCRPLDGRCLVVFPGSGCQFHLQQNAQASVPRQELTAEVAAAIQAIFTAPDRADADALLARTVQTYSKTASKRATWLETAIPAGLTVFAVPASHRQRLRTVSGRARRNQEIRRRTRVVGVFPNEASCLCNCLWVAIYKLLDRLYLGQGQIIAEDQRLTHSEIHL
jgi:transposase-like protein